MPKESNKAQSIQTKANLLRLRQKIPRNDGETRAVNDGVAGHGKRSPSLCPAPRRLSDDCFR